MKIEVEFENDEVAEKFKDEKITIEIDENNIATVYQLTTSQCAVEAIANFDIEARQN